jgi:hypothetical protein
MGALSVPLRRGRVVESFLDEHAIESDALTLTLSRSVVAMARVAAQGRLAGPTVDAWRARRNWK